VEVGRRRRSIGTQRALGRRGARSAASLDVDLIALIDRLSRRLRGAHRACRTVVLRLRFDDLSRATRSRSMVEATTDTATLLATGRGLLASAMPTIVERGITLIGVSFTGLVDDSAIQAALPLGELPATDSAVDLVRDRFGSSSITRGVLLGRREDLRVPLLPD
jgi:DNA polymerase-4